MIWMLLDYFPSTGTHATENKTDFFFNSDNKLFKYEYFDDHYHVYKFFSFHLKFQFILIIRQINKSTKIRIQFSSKLI